MTEDNNTCRICGEIHYLEEDDNEHRYQLRQQRWDELYSSGSSDYQQANLKYGY